MAAPPHADILSSQLDDNSFYHIEQWEEQAGQSQDQLMDGGKIPTTGKRQLDELYTDEPEETPKRPTKRKRKSGKSLAPFSKSLTLIFLVASSAKPKANRFDTSLSILTEKFVKLIHQDSVCVFSFVAVVLIYLIL